VFSEFLPSLSSRLASLSSSTHASTKVATTTSAARQKDTDQITALTSEVRSHINTLLAFASKYSNAALAAARREENWDKRGTELWNLCARLNRTDSNGLERAPASSSPPSFSSLLALARLLAFLFLDYGFKSSGHSRRRKIGIDGGGGAGTQAQAQAQKSSEFGRIVRLLKVANKAARACLVQRHVELASKVLERAAEYEDAVAKTGGVSEGQVRDDERNVERDGDNSKMVSGLRADYLGLRIMLVCSALGGTCLGLFEFDTDYEIGVETSETRYG